MYSLVLRNVAQTRRVAFTAIARYCSTMSDNDPHLLEMEKKRNLQNIQHRTSTPHEYAPGWNEVLATASEATIKADKSTDSIVDLQRKTVNYIRARHSPDDRVGSHEADYSHDSVMGPLSGAPGVEDLQNNHEKVKKKKKVVREKVVEEIRQVKE